jgi:hypothetical protein
MPARISMNLILGALRRGDSAALCEAVRQDMIEGGRLFIRHLEKMEAGGEAAESPPAPDNAPAPQ